MKKIKQKFPVSFRYEVYFTEGLFQTENPVFAETVSSAAGRSDEVPKVLFVFDKGMFDHHPDLFDRIREYAFAHEGVFEPVGEPVVIPGGEAAKNDRDAVDKIYAAVNKADLDRHSFVTAIGGGAAIDAAGYAAGTAHRGIRLIRVPTTVLAQNDASVGVKNGINAFGKKNFLGTFVPPFAVLNDFQFLHTLDDRDWRSGIAEAIKVGLIRDAGFFRSLEEDADELANREPEPMKELIYRCAELHLDHIATSGDPFETGSSRPLDFGHWSAHKLEQLSGFELRHGEAVAIGIALDATYSYLLHLVPRSQWERILRLFKRVGFRLYVTELSSRLDRPEKEESIFRGLEEFREHLGGELTIMLLEEIGKAVEAHEVDLDLFRKAIGMLREFEEAWEEDETAVNP